MKPLYAIYDDDDFVAIGTADELAESLGVKRETIMWLTSPTAHKRRGRIAIRVEQGDNAIAVFHT